MTMPEPADPWRGQRKPGPHGAGAGLATQTAERPGDHIALPALPVAAGWARRRGGEVLRGWNLAEDTVDVVSLLISELVTNALLHGLPDALAEETADGAAEGITEGTPEGTADGTAARCPRCGGQICVNLREEPGAVVVEVFDGGTSAPHLAGEAFEPALPLDDESGRGLMIVANLSEEQGYYLPPDGGKVVWCAVKAEC
jgi:anti-sigma regulatory factor (Ser/Thr protein kinase)